MYVKKKRFDLDISKWGYFWKMNVWVLCMRTNPRISVRNISLFIRGFQTPMPMLLYLTYINAQVTWITYGRSCSIFVAIFIHFLICISIESLFTQWIIKNELMKRMWFRCLDHRIKETRQFLEWYINMTFCFRSEVVYRY